MMFDVGFFKIKMVGKVLGCCEAIEAIAMCGKTNADKITST